MNRKEIKEILDDCIGFPPAYTPEWIDMDLSSEQIIKLFQIKVGEIETTMLKSEHYYNSVQKFLLSNDWQVLKRQELPDA